MSIKGQLQASLVNDFGYPRIKVSGVWYGGDKKQKLEVAEGDLVEFESFKNNRGYDTFKAQSIKKIAGEPAVVANAPAGTGSQAKAYAGASSGTGTSRDSYWSDKAKSDEAKDPRIAYFAASERAIQFVALALQAGALGALAKAKETSKLEILTALVDEQTQRLLVASYAQEVPLQATPAKAIEAPAAEPSESEGTWK